MRLKLTVLVLCSLFFTPLWAQQNDDYKAEWKKISALEKKGLTKGALAGVVKIFDAANKTGNESQQIKAAMYQMKYRNMVEEDNNENNIFFVDTLIAKTKAPAKNILQSMQADLFWAYKQKNRYKLYNRTALTEEKSHDINTWSIDKLNAVMASLYKSSLKNESILKNTSLNGLDAIITKGENTRSLRPTVYDLLAHRALAYFMNSENDVTNPSYKFLLNDERIFSPVNTFINASFITKDSASLYYNAILLLQDILRFHSNDANPDALIDADLKRLAFVYQHAVISNKDKLYEAALTNMETTYGNNPMAGEAMYLRAALYYSQGQLYNPFTKKENQFQLKKAKELCDLVINKFPKTEGAIDANNLLLQILQPYIYMQTEKVNIPGQAFRSLLKYKNAATLYLRVIKTSRDEIKRLQKDDYDKLWQNIAGLKAAKSWSVGLPNLQDFQQHAVEIKVDGLAPGTYYILASVKPDFSLSDNFLVKQVIYVSNISYISNNKDQVYILDRDNGEPLPGAEVQFWQQKYNYTTNSYEEVKKEKYIADKNGLVRLKKIKDDYGYNSFMQVKFNSEELFTDDNYYNNYYNGYQPPTTKRTFFFTDRSIYRPGQLVYFKGIILRTDSATKKTDIINNYKTAIILYDANQQKLSSIRLVSNEYGSFSGSFKLPEGLLNGQFRIQDSVSNSTQYFSVEEYKRPKFLVEIKKPEGLYRLNDSIKVTGNAKAYAGNNIDGAKVVYRIVREVRYPIWFWGGYIRGPYPRTTEQMEIGNGQTTTDNNGEFFISFKAIPDETVDKSSQPIFSYRVSADITDINGETRSSYTSVKVAYQALQLNIIAPDKLSTDSIKNIKISSTNLNDLFEKSTVNLTAWRLQSPQRIFRSRFWEMPDQAVMTREEYYASFPYDVYMDEDQVSKWPIREKVIDITDTTSSNFTFNIQHSKLPSGWYKIIVNTKDKFGEDVKAEKYIQLTDNSTLSALNEPIMVKTDNVVIKPGEKISYSIATGFSKIWLIHSIGKIDKSINTSYQAISSVSPFNNEIIATENDRGGMNLTYAFVQHNRTYNGTQFFGIPWTNKNLDISYETFRDKILPGSEEKWKIKISGEGSEKLAAEALISMYDASLDQFKPHSWSSLKSIWPSFANGISWTANDFASIGSEELNRIKNDYLEAIPKSYDELTNNGWNEGGTYYYAYRNGVDIEKTITIRAEAALGVSAPMMNRDKSEEFKEDAVSGAYQTKRTLRSQASNVQTIDDAKAKDLPLSPDEEKQTAGSTEVQIRKNFNETAFFFPALYTDANGNIEFTFTAPEALTKWKMMTMAHTKELASGYSETSVITQKQLMVQPNAPRFLREGDRMEFSAKISNMSSTELTGTATLELFDAATGKIVDGWFKNIFPLQYFTVAAGQAVAVKFPVDIPISFSSALSYRIKAISKSTPAGSFSDGEEAALPVLTNRMLVTETLPLNMRNTTSKNFKFDKLLSANNSGSLTNHALTLEYTSNPAWYAVQALPYLMEYPYECAEQSFNRYYANTLAAYISNSVPKIKAVFEKWKTTDTTALMSNLQKNEELKSVLLQETPWVLNAQNESTQKKNIALLFDMVRMSAEKEKTLNKLKDMQSSNGGFTWFKGGPDDRYITQYIITGIGHLRKLNALSITDYSKVKTIVDKAIPYLDKKLKEEYDYLVKYKINLKSNNLSYTAIQYLYMRSFFTETKIATETKTAFEYFSNQEIKYWLSQSKYMQAMIALSLYRNNNEKTAQAIINSLKENAINKEEMGMYWKDLATGGYYWYQAPIESQAMIIEAFTDIDKNKTTIDDLKTWLLKQKQTNQWPTTKATSEACYALLLNGNDWLSEEKTVSISLGNTTIKSSDNPSEAGTGYFKQTMPGDKVQQGMGNITVSINSLNSKVPPSGGGGGSWGAVYWQYFEDLDKITSAETPLKLVKKLFIEKNSDKGPVLTALNDGDELHIGDKVKVRIELRSDRDMEYIHMKDMRAACMEPVNVISQYKYQGGLGYYESTKDASTNFFFGSLPRGIYVFEYPMFVTHAGNFSNGVTNIECMYAPEFTSHSEGIRVTVD